jgi:hypothetical protein
VERSTAAGFADRQADVDAFLHHIRQNQLLVFHGESGAGKTSLINVKIIEELWGEDYAPMLCRDWSGATTPGERPDDKLIPRVDNFLRHKLRESGWLHQDLATKIKAKTPLAHAIEDAYGFKGVLILDQFEEVLRSDPRFARAALGWVIAANARYNFKVVLSMRSEQLYMVSERLRDAHPFTTYFLKLQRLEGEEQAKHIIDAPGRGSDQTTSLITTEAAKLLAKWWDKPSSDPAGRHGVLGLQAALYVLHFKYKELDSPVTKENLKSLAKDAGSAFDVFSYCLGELMNIQLSFASRAALGRRQDGVSAEDSGAAGARLPQSLTLATTRAVVNLVPSLSSGDYKIERSLTDLFELAFARSLLSLGVEKEERRKIAEAIAMARAKPFDYLSATTTELAKTLELGEQENVALEPEPDRWTATICPVPWSADDKEERERSNSAGPVFSFLRGRVLTEMIRSFLFAVEWLEAATLIRVSGLSAALVHDGFGRPLTRWSGDHELHSRREAALSRTALDGEFIFWGDSSDEDPRIICDARWVNSVVKGTTFKHVVFLNCDLHATAFIGCTFEGVVFVNCRLDGAMLKACAIRGGTASWREHHGAPTERVDFPSFHLSAAADEGAADPFASSVAESIAELAWYRDYRSADGRTAFGLLYSPQSGVAAVPLAKLPEDRESRRIVPADGGLVVCGGRLSALMVAQCAFPRLEEGDFALCLLDVAGSSLDFNEQRGGSVLIKGASIRGLGYSRPLSDILATGDAGDAGAQAAAATSQNEPTDEIRLRVEDSALFDLFLGPRLTGKVEIDGCALLGATQASAELTVTVTNSRVGQHNFPLSADEDNPASVQPFQPEPGSDWFLDASTQAVVYRSEPGRYEFERERQRERQRQRHRERETRAKEQPRKR